MKTLTIMLLAVVLLVSSFPAHAQAPDGYNFPWQTTGPSRAELAYQIAVVSLRAGYRVTWPPEPLDNGAQLLIWLDIGDDDPAVALNRVLCGLSFAFPQWRSSRSACSWVWAVR